MINKNKKILIVGLGLIGGSYAKAFRKNGYEVGAITLNKSDIEYAINNNIISHGQTRVTKNYLSNFDIIILSLYPSDMVRWVEKYHSYFKKDAILSDVCGVKGNIVYKIQEILKDKHEFVAAHPMAGKEVSGVINADETIFQNANYIVVHTKNNTKDGIEMAKDIGKLLEFKNISVLSPKKHDEMIAFLSQLTHCLAITLMNCKASHHLKDYTGDSFKDLTRIAKINDKLWSELFLANKEELLLQMDLFMNSFLELKEYIDKEDVESIKKMMKISTKRRKYFD